ncbi:MAG: HlyC/CorC family transporter [Burkholderiales bacterium]|nr:HlyC/CorC family transporter [Burkholderiales bacterium]
MDAIPLGWQFAVLAALLAVSGVFSLAETSMMALNRYRLRAMVRAGHRGAKIAADLLARTDRLLGVILLMNNLVNAAAAVLVSAMTVQLFGQNEIALGLGTLCVTFLILVFSEITPKVIGAAYPERIALPLAFGLRPLLAALSPVVWFVNMFVSALLFVLRLKPQQPEQNQRLTVQELRHLVLESGQFMPKKPHSILVNLLDLEKITVEDVMTPRARIEAIDIEAPLETIHEQLATSYHTRLVVYRGEPGTVIGLLHLRRVLRPLQHHALDKQAIQAMLAEPYFVPAGTRALAQLQYFQEAGQRIALVVDEYGELLGLVTLEDIIEEIVGEFTTTAPVGASAYAWAGDGTALIEGTATLRALNRKLGLSLPVDGPKTLNGLILEHLQDIPESGVSVKIAGVPMEMVQTQDRVIRTVRIFRPPLAGSESGP